MRVLTFCILIAQASQGLAQSALEATKSSGASQVTSSTGNGMMPMVQMLVALGIVAALLKFVLPKLSPSLKTKFNSSLGSTLRVEESTTVPGGSICVISVRGRTLLIGVNPQTISLLSDLTASERETAKEPAFFEMVDQAPITSAVVHLVEEPAETVTSTPAAAVDRTEILSRLERLNRLSS